MPLHEYVGNLHIHTPYSDGTEYHNDIATAARRAGIDFIVVTDHNILIQGIEGYYGDDDQGYVLLLTGEEIHDRFRLPQVNHCLVYDVPEEMTRFADEPRCLIDAVAARKGLSFLAHPTDPQIAWMHPESDGIGIPWVDDSVRGFTGLEIWNYMSSWKGTATSVYQMLRSAFKPEDFVIGPDAETLALWDRLLERGDRVTGIGNSDAHGTRFHVGPLEHRLFPYDFLFNCVNTHLLTPLPLAGILTEDRALLFNALRDGHTFIGYDIPGDTRGFRYTAQGEASRVIMGDQIRLGSGVTLQAVLPAKGDIRIIRHGEIVAESERTEAIIYTVREPGAYRVEVWRPYQGKDRCWILSNPIYVVK